MSRKKKVGLIVLSIVVLIAVLSMTLISCAPLPANVDNLLIAVDMGNQYYVGTHGSVDLAKSFGNAECSITSGDSAIITENILTVSGKTNFEMKIADKIKKVTVVDGAYNVSEYSEFYDKVSSGEKVVIHSDNFIMPASGITNGGTINVKNDVYGNGVTIDGYAVAKATDKGKKVNEIAGATVMSVSVSKKLIIRDVHIFGKAPSADDKIEAYNNYGTVLAIEGSSSKSNVDVIHCVFENSHKVVHIRNANVNMEGTIVRNASDTAISIGTYADQASNVKFKNMLVSNSLTGGIVVYCYDAGGFPKIDKSKDNANTWNIVTVEGFLDIYNWKSATELYFLPKTELQGNKTLVDMINSYVSSEVSPKKNYKELKAVARDGKQYVHMGIFKICTAGYGFNKSEINFRQEQGYTSKAFPMPKIAEAIMKEAIVYGYFGNNKGAVTTESRITNINLPLIYKQLREGR